MREIMKDPEVIAAIEVLKSKGVTLEQITQVYRNYTNLPAPGSRIQFLYGIYTVLENPSQIYRVVDGYIRIKNSAGTDLYLRPHEYRVMADPTSAKEV